MTLNSTMSAIISAPQFARRNGLAAHNEIARAPDALNHLAATCRREDWVKAAMAAKSAGLRFDDFHSWSANGGKYKSERDCMAVWRYIKTDKGIGAGTLFHM